MSRLRPRLHRLAAGAGLLAVAGPAVAQGPATASPASAQSPMASNGSSRLLDSLTVAGHRWRTVGPANFMGRLSDVVGIPSPSKTVFIAAAAGGIWKSTNNGITWRPTFDDKRVISMGMLAIAPTDLFKLY